MKKWLDRLSANGLRHLLNWWPPYRFSGIKIISISPDYRQIQVSLKEHWYNKNYVGTHYGGSIFSMTDPFYMLILIRNLGKNYIVWDKAATIEFVKPGKGTLTANFSFSKEELQDIRNKLCVQEKLIFDKEVKVINEDGEVVASVVKKLYVKPKP